MNALPKLSSSFVVIRASMFAQHPGNHKGTDVRNKVCARVTLG
jgi:hypothetical protein